MACDGLKSYFMKNADKMAEDIGRLVSIKSVRGDSEPGAPYGRGPRLAIEEFAVMAREYGFCADILGDRFCIIEYGEGEPELGILAHLDVVPSGSGWDTEPYTCVRRGDELFGRGVSDDKGPAVAALYALMAVRETQTKLCRKVQLILGSDEECGSSDVAWFLENYNMPPKVFTPDGSFPVVNTEKGRLCVRFTSAPDLSGDILYIRGGTAVNVVPDRAEAVLRNVMPEDLSDVIKMCERETGALFSFSEESGNIRVSCKGRAAHASICGEGINAVTALLKCITSLKLGKTAGWEAVNALYSALPFGDVSANAVNASCKDDISGELTVNLGMLSYDEDGIFAELDCRVPLCGDIDKIFSAFSSAVKPGGVKSEIITSLKPHNTPAESDFVRGLLRIYEECTGEKGYTMSMGGITYAHGIDGGVAFGCSFPGRESNVHEANEKISLSDLLMSGQMFAQAILEFCKGGKSDCGDMRK